MSNQLFYEHGAVSRTGNAGAVVVSAIAAEQMEGLHFTRTPRAGDEHRQRYLAHLGELFALGYIDQAEHDARAAVAAEAAEKATLAALLGDLPALPAGPEAKTPARERWARRLAKPETRGIAHGLVAALTLSLAIAIPVAVATPHGWDHSALRVLILAGAVIAGVVGFIVNLVLFCCWVDA